MDWKDNPRLIANLDSVQQQIQAAGQYVYEKFIRTSDGMLRHFPVHSPIEATFYTWWGALLATHEINESEFSLGKQTQIECAGRQYRLDFSIVPDVTREGLSKQSGVPLPKIAVECDGHDYHERTREQVIERNERDRMLQANGWIVLHFSGSELHRDAYHCVLSVYGEANSRYWAFERAAFAAIFAAERAAGNLVGALTTQES